MYNPLRLGFIFILIVISTAFLSADEDAQRYARLSLGVGYHQINELSEENLSPGTNTLHSVAASISVTREITDSLLIGGQVRMMGPIDGHATIDGERYRIDRDDYDSMFAVDVSLPLSYYAYVGGLNSIEIGIGPHVGRLMYTQSQAVFTYYGVETVYASYSTIAVGLSANIAANLALDEHAAIRFGVSPYYDFYELETVWTSYGTDFRDGVTDIKGFAFTIGLGIRINP